MTAGRWPEPVREPLPVALINPQDIEAALRITDRHMAEPEDPAFDRVAFGALCAARTVLIECAEILNLARIDRELHGTDVEYREWDRIGREYAARTVARKAINELRRWLP